MAWNQPGGNGGRDPWGSRGQQGPPDLDEALKKLQAQLGRIFGRRGRGGQPGGGGGLGTGGGLVGAGVIVVVLIAAWAISSFYIVDPAEAGVVLRFGKYHTTTGPGLHWAPRFIDSVEKVNIAEIRSQEIGFRSTGGGSNSVPNESLMLTEDENVIDIKFAVQYRVKDAQAYLFNVLEPDLTLRQATESAVREIVGRSGMDFVITEGRDAVAAEAETLIQEILDRYEAGLNITSVNMQDAQPPAQVQEAFFDAVKAREDQERIINEANAYKADIVPKARGDANAIREQAEAYRQRVIAAAEGDTSRFSQVLSEYEKAPEVTRERLYIETVEQVMANSTKVLVDLQGGNNLLFLPLDKLLSGNLRADSDREPLGQSNELGAARQSFNDMRRSRDALSGRNR
ncbi:MAG: FtsH protease activity modulator HflK [Gammaproteobacteria bacterium]|nr:FtsH protease activity modulator HflK [Gammaproteobacteria bacterium]